ncbi:MAG TPA: hypothetical protein VLL94_07135, partial [Nitrospiraceae bacterium]|nr:hypothetical protein [Nitrospiraceae bacterium]
MKHLMTLTLAATALFAVLVGTAAAETPFEGRKKCSNCHKSEADSWLKNQTEARSHLARRWPRPIPPGARIMTTLDD